MGTAVFILEAVVVILSFLAGFGALGGPVIVRIALAFCALFIIPGFSLSVLVFRSRASIPEAACRIFSMGLCFRLHRRVRGLRAGRFLSRDFIRRVGSRDRARISRAFEFDPSVAREGRASGRRSVRRLRRGLFGHRRAGLEHGFARPRELCEPQRRERRPFSPRFVLPGRGRDLGRSPQRALASRALPLDVSDARAGLPRLARCTGLPLVLCHLLVSLFCDSVLRLDALRGALSRVLSSVLRRRWNHLAHEGRIQQERRADRSLDRPRFSLRVLPYGKTGVSLRERAPRVRRHGVSRCVRDAPRRFPCRRISLCHASAKRRRLARRVLAERPVAARGHGDSTRDSGSRRVCSLPPRFTRTCRGCSFFPPTWRSSIRPNW